MRIKKALPLVLIAAIFASLLFACAACAASSSDFFQLCRKGSIEEIRAAIDAGADVNAQENGGHTVLMMVAYLLPDPLPVMQILIAKGADVNLQTDDGQTALMFALMAIQRQEPEKAISLLLDSGANPDLKYKAEKTALDIAIDMGRYKGTEILKRLEAATTAKTKSE